MVVFNSLPPSQRRKIRQQYHDHYEEHGSDVRKARGAFNKWHKTEHKEDPASHENSTKNSSNTDAEHTQTIGKWRHGKGVKTLQTGHGEYQITDKEVSYTPNGSSVTNEPITVGKSRKAAQKHHNESGHSGNLSWVEGKDGATAKTDSGYYAHVGNKVTYHQNDEEDPEPISLGKKGTPEHNMRTIYKHHHALVNGGNAHKKDEGA